MDDAVTLEFHDAPGPFLAAAGGLLAAEPVLGSVIASVSQRIERELAEGRDSWAEADAEFQRWWLVVRDPSGRAVSAAMRTAPFRPHPTFALPMSDGAAPCCILRGTGAISGSRMIRGGSLYGNKPNGRVASGSASGGGAVLI